MTKSKKPELPRLPMVKPGSRSLQLSRIIPPPAVPRPPQPWRVPVAQPSRAAATPRAPQPVPPPRPVAQARPALPGLAARPLPSEAVVQHSEWALLAALNARGRRYVPLKLFTDREPCRDCEANIRTASGRALERAPIGSQCFTSRPTRLGVTPRPWRPGRSGPGGNPEGESPVGRGVER